MSKVPPQLQRVGRSLLKDLSIQIGKHKAHILPMVVSVASHEWRKSGSLVDYQDVLAEALLGLAKADQDFKRRRGTKFSTYAHIRVRGAALDIIRREAANAKKHVLTDGTFFLKQRVEPTVEVEVALQQQYRQALDIIHRELPRAQSAVLILFYLSNRTESEIAEKLQCSAGKVNKTKQVALAEVKKAMNKRGHYAVVE